jgi:peroxiredoxin
MFACTQNKMSKGILTGTLENAPDSIMINLVDVDNGKVFKKILMQNGKFNLSFYLKTPRFFVIQKENSKSDSDKLFLWLENSKINITGNFNNINWAIINGSSSNEIYKKYLEIEKDYETIKATSLSLLKNVTNNQQTLDSVQKQNELILVHYRPALLKFYSDNINSEVAFYFLYKEPIKYQSALLKSDIKQIYNNLPEEKKHSKEGKLLKDFSSLPDIPKIGDKYIDISQDTPEGRSESISKNLGKYTILEFWSSGCPPSLWFRSRLKTMYNLYHKRGLNIIGISGDDNYDDWRKAIEKDTIPWVNISDLKGWYNKAFLSYGVYYTPNMILLDDKGVILDNQFFQKWIENELERKFK